MGQYPTAPPGPETWYPSPTPGVWPWFIVYCVVMAILYLFVAGAGSIFFVIDPAELEMDPVEAKIMGTVYVGIGLMLLVPFALGPFLPRRKWVWVYDLVLICLGMTSCCTLPACIALLIFWIKPETRYFFGWT